jgi:hypothetical protein
MEFSVSKSALLKKKPQGSADSGLGYTVLSRMARLGGAKALSADCTMGCVKGLPP